MTGTFFGRESHNEGYSIIGILGSILGTINPKIWCCLFMETAIHCIIMVSDFVLLRVAACPDQAMLRREGGKAHGKCTDYHHTPRAVELFRV